MKSQEKKTIYVAMSGGVDSSVAAALLKKQGYDVTGVFMKPWSPYGTNSKLETLNSKQAQNSPPEADPPSAEKFQIQNSSFCLWQKDREDAMKVAAKLSIPLLTWDFSKEYKREVADYMIREYRSGRTPNPDVMCNKHIKFGLFLEKALKEGADLIATGHYARLQRETRNSKLETLNKLKIKNSKKIGNLNIENSLKIENYKLKIAIDKNKDQRYFLWTLTQKQLKYCLFPIGDYTKPEVRRMAKKFGLPTADKKDSQGVCFVGPLNVKEFLKNYIKPKRGRILDTGKKLVGEHDGVYYYTIGQRHGLDIKNGKGPYYIARKDIKRNIIYVSARQNIKHKTQITNVNWTEKQPKLPAKINVKIRYRSESIPVVIKLCNLAYQLTSLPAYQLKSVTPGQSAVFYRDDELLGGGVIK